MSRSGVGFSVLCLDHRILIDSIILYILCHYSIVTFLFWQFFHLHLQLKAWALKSVILILYFWTIPHTQLGETSINGSVWIRSKHLFSQKFIPRSVFWREEFYPEVIMVSVHHLTLVILVRHPEVVGRFIGFLLRSLIPNIYDTCSFKIYITIVCHL